MQTKTSKSLHKGRTYSNVHSMLEISIASESDDKEHFRRGEKDFSILTEYFKSTINDMIKREKNMLTSLNNIV